jgi:purine-binding chemotaxis protein CheW
MRCIVFTVGDRGRYALPLAAVREVLLPAPLSRVPRAPPALAGIMNHRGRVITVADLGEMLGARGKVSPDARLLLLDRGRRDLALRVFGVDGIRDLPEPQPAGAALPIAGYVEPEGEVAVAVLDSDSLVGGLERLVEARR